MALSSYLMMSALPNVTWDKLKTMIGTFLMEILIDVNVWVS